MSALERLKEARRVITAMQDFLEVAELRNPMDDIKVEGLLARAEAWLRVSDPKGDQP